MKKGRPVGRPFSWFLDAWWRAGCVLATRGLLLALGRGLDGGLELVGGGGGLEEGGDLAVGGDHGDAGEAADFVVGDDGIAGLVKLGATFTTIYRLIGVVSSTV